MASRETKHRAQDELLSGMANAILGEHEAYQPDTVLIAEMQQQARRVMKFFGVESYPGLGSTDAADADAGRDGS